MTASPAKRYRPETRLVHSGTMRPHLRRPRKRPSRRMETRPAAAAPFETRPAGTPQGEAESLSLSLYRTGDLTGSRPRRMIAFIPWSFEPAGLLATLNN